MEASPSPQQSNVTSYGAITVAIITLVEFPGMWINAFIVGVLCIGWVKKKTLNSNEKILLLLGCSRISFLCFTWVSHFLSIIYPNYFYGYPTLQLLTTFQTFFNYSTMSVSACLCGFYCIKIANFRNKFFIYLKVKIDRMVPWLLLGSEILSLAISIITYDVMETLQRNNVTFTYEENFWEARITMDKHIFSSFFLAGFGYAVSFTAAIFSALLLLFSLWRHKRRMQTNSMKDLSMEAHIRAMKSVLSFLVMYSINFLCLILIIIYTTKKENIKTLLISLYLYAFPGIHSLILIFSNPKLEKALLKMLSSVKCKFSMSRKCDKSWSPCKMLIFYCRKQVISLLMQLSRQCR
ncbi:LOW QUALITY PROTEIN: taste receptor type 2 member 7-like [Motacilla alba alba]|uniref:LOW QUALITY PROTEIN: taste receptor type 2 member 7-like n=1 Tax=Motacilla alba alba TaxID=1094192 RepID=UPI0018D550C7|nr:LOW QUALITY PROTEIN: taste receptor type 2 member 7-like [Motacilla alba alba]